MQPAVSLSTKDRREQIAQIICMGGRPDIPHLMELFGVSQVTIYRDLKCPEVKQVVKEIITAQISTTDLVDAMKCVRKAIQDGDVVSARWLIDKTIDSDSNDKNIKPSQSIQDILGVDSDTED